MLTYALDYLNHNTEEDRRDVALELEVEIIKCIKAMVNTKAGKKEVMDHPEYIHTVVFSIICPQWQTRKIVCELLAFLCYSEAYEHVIRGFEQLKKFKKSLSLFESWISVLLRIVSVDMYSRKEKLPESHLMEYAVSTHMILKTDFLTHIINKLSNMILVNALVSIPPDINYRIYIRNQFAAAGLQSNLLPNLETLDYRLLNLQIESFKEAADNDMDEAFEDETSINSEQFQPSELLEQILENISDSAKGTEYLMSSLKYLLWIKGDPETK